ncbi:unnamed protein product [Pleuronectes platessa]|uniref:Uncharacterized protein n=1 Tax=Pleuronectes platessa TaxID=8262 RepID=A0A9N7VJB5_PLEPL|nr:unnamed protein product [Pleuronectes platessa]
MNNESPLRGDHIDTSVGIFYGLAGKTPENFQSFSPCSHISSSGGMSGAYLEFSACQRTSPKTLTWTEIVCIHLFLTSSLAPLLPPSSLPRSLAGSFFSLSILDPDFPRSLSSPSCLSPSSSPLSSRSPFQSSSLPPCSSSSSSSSSLSSLLFDFSLSRPLDEALLLTSPPSQPPLLLTFTFIIHHHSHYPSLMVPGITQSPCTELDSEASRIQILYELLLIHDGSDVELLGEAHDDHEEQQTTRAEAPTARHITWNSVTTDSQRAPCARCSPGRYIWSRRWRGEKERTRAEGNMKIEENEDEMRSVRNKTSELSSTRGHTNHRQMARLHKVVNVAQQLNLFRHLTRPQLQLESATTTAITTTTYTTITITTTPPH